MKIGRRKFFGLAVGAAVGGKMAAREVLGQVTSPMMLQQAGLIGSPYMGAAQAGIPTDYIASLKAEAAKRAALKLTGIPDALKEFICGGLGAPAINLEDINCLRSISASAKQRMINERLKERACEDWLNGPSRQLERELARKQFGSEFL